MRRVSVSEAVAQRTQKTDTCWVWTGNVCPDHDYGRLGIGQKNYRAHRLAYELAKGPIPEGLVVDHTCHNSDQNCPGGGTCLHRRCVNPDHLEAVPHRVNTLRGAGISAQKARATACKHGHAWTPENTIIQRGNRLCRICRDRRSAQRPRLTDPSRCKHGHEWTPENTYVDVRGHRSCRTCHRIGMRNRRAAAE